MAQSSRSAVRARRWSFRVVVAIAAVTLSACFAPAPKPAPAPPSTTTTTTTAPAPAHLSVSPPSVLLSVQQNTVDSAFAPLTITNTGGQPTGVISADLAPLAEPGTAPGETTLFELLADHCSGQTLAPGASCDVVLHFKAIAYANPAPWTADLPITASPGGTAPVSVTAQYSSNLVFQQETHLVSTANPLSVGSTHFVVTNATDQDITHFELSWNGGGPGSLYPWTISQDQNFGVPSCVAGMTLPAHGSCHWLISYANTTGTGSDVISVHAAGDGVDPNYPVFGLVYGTSQP
jgi:hypothetical protein